MAGELILGRYRVISQAGSGGYATVQLAWDTRIQRRVAIKCLQLDPDVAAKAAGANSVSLYSAVDIPGLEEARTAAMLQDSNIVGILDFEIQDGVAYLIMEYVDGITLSQLMDEYGDLVNLDIIAAVFSAVAHALEVAHGNQVLHLDIKPDNVMINHQGRVLVTDFGLSRLSSSSGYSRATGGTIGYMPLEQMQLKTLDARCDEWALASLTYEMISGSNPFDAPDLDHAEGAILNAELVLPSVCMPDLDEQADDVIFYALDPEREERYESVADFAEELQPFLGNVRRGTKQLSQIVGNAVDDANDAYMFVGEEENQGVAALGRRLGKMGAFGQDGAGKRSYRKLVYRLWSLLNCAILSFVGCAGIAWFDAVGAPLRLLPLLAICAAALIVPYISAAAAMATVGLAFCSQGAYVCGGLCLVPALIWLVLMIRQDAQSPLAVLSASTCGCFGGAGVAPLIGSLDVDVPESLVNAAASLFLAVALATMGSNSIFAWNAPEALPALAGAYMGKMQVYITANCDQNLLALLGRPLFWLDAASWMLCALVCGFASGFGGKPRRVLGVLLGMCVLLAAAVGRTWLYSGGAAYIPSQSQIAALSFVGLIALVVALASNTRKLRA